MLLTWEVSGQDSFFSYAQRENLLPAHLDELRRKGAESPSGRARLCLHTDPNDSLHVMLIYHDERTLVPTHRHRPFGEYIIMLEGSIDIIRFDEGLSPAFVRSLQDQTTQLPVWIPPDTWHTLIFQKPTLFYEVSEGPFNAKTTDVAY